VKLNVLTEIYPMNLFGQNLELEIKDYRPTFSLLVQFTTSLSSAFRSAADATD